MPKKRLLWQLYPSYVIIAMGAVIGTGWLAGRWFEHFYSIEAQNRLETAARMAESAVGNELRPAQNSRLKQVLSNIAPLDAQRVRLMNASGGIVFDSAGDAARDIDPKSAREVQAMIAGSPKRGTRYNAELEHREAYFAMPLRRNGTIVGGIELRRSLAELDAALARIQMRIVLAGLGLAALAVALSPILSRQVTRPIEEMRSAAQRYARGELGYKLPIPQAEELAALAEALNQMAAQLQERISTIVRQNNEQQAILSSMVEGVLAVDNHERVISLNKASGQLLGIEKDQAQGRRLQEVVRNADLQRFVTRALKCEEPIDDDVVLHGDHEGVLQARGAALHDGLGHAIGAVIVLNDVTEFRRLEHIRRDFVANVSHELKTPITSIKGFVETLLDGAMQTPTDAERFLRIVAKQAERLNSIIEDLLSLSRIEQGEEAADIVLETGPLPPVLEAAIHNCETQAADRNISVQLECPAGIEAKLNAALLEEAVTNLLDNAIKYSEPGAAVAINASLKRNEVTIAVSDKGCGIPAEHLSRIFERFYRVDKARSRKLGGTGLGLAIVKHIVQAHHGRVSVRSTLGFGSTFTIYLPVAETTNDRAASSDNGHGKAAS